MSKVVDDPKETIPSNSVVPFNDETSVNEGVPTTTSQLRRSLSGPEDFVVLQSSFFQTFGRYGIPLVLITSISLLWTLWLVFLNTDPNYTANRLASTEEYDNGEFWMIVEPNTPFKAIIVGTLSFLILCYMYVLRLLVIKDRPIAVKKKSNVASVASCDFTVGQLLLSSKENRKSLIRQVWSSVTGYEGKYRRVWNVLLKSGDLIMQSITQYRMMESGSPTELIYCCGVLVSANSLSCATLILFGKDISAFSEVVLDSVFDMMIAVGFPIASMVFAYYKLNLDHGMLELRNSAFGPGAFDRVIRLHSDPIQVTRFRMSFDNQRITSVMDYIIQISINLAFCYRLQRLTEILKHKAHIQEHCLEAKDAVKRRKQTRVPKVVAALFLVMSVLSIYVPMTAIERTNAICEPHPECVMYAYRYESMESCPCIGLVDVDPAIKSYEEWIEPKDISAAVKELAKSRDLQIIMIMNRRLEVLPKELQYCTQLKILYLMYTGVTELPDWFGKLKNLEIMQVEGKTMDTNLIKIDENAMKGKEWLTYFHLGLHPNLPAIPTLEDSTHLRYIVVAFVFKLEQLPSFASMHRLENFVIGYAPRLISLPDMSPVGELSSFVIGLTAPLCCNGFMGDCDLTHPYCRGDPVSGAPPSQCLDEASPLKATPATLKLLNTHSYSICNLPQSGVDLTTLPPTKESIEICNGTMYKECQITVPYTNTSTVYPGICYPSRMRAIFCSTDEVFVKFRKKQIELGVGSPCDPEEEAWLGCSR